MLFLLSLEIEEMIGVLMDLHRAPAMKTIECSRGE
jgi:hypothetical protein